MVQVTSPDNINKWTATDPTSIYQASQSQGDSVQTALNKRQRYDYVWPTAPDRTAQTGMVQGSRGYQIDTKSEYLYDNSAWRRTLEHSEFTATTGSVTNGNLIVAGTFVMDATYTNSTSMATSSGLADGTVTLARPGLYAISTLSYLSALHMGSGSYMLVSTNAASVFDSAISRVNFSDNMCTTAFPNLLTTTANQTLVVNMANISGGTVSGMPTRLRITRLA